MDSLTSTESPIDMPNSKSDLSAYYIAFQDGAQSKFICNFQVCKKIFRYKSEMQRHILSHMDLRIHKCHYEGCQKKFKKTNSLENHIRARHTGEAPLVCPQPGCQKHFTTDSRLYYHIRQHLDVRPHHCTHPGCDRSFLTVSQVKNHAKWIHKGQAEASPQDSTGSLSTVAEELTKKVKTESIKVKREDNLGLSLKIESTKVKWEDDSTLNSKAESVEAKQEDISHLNIKIEPVTVKYEDAPHLTTKIESVKVKRENTPCICNASSGFDYNPSIHDPSQTMSRIKFEQDDKFYGALALMLKDSSYNMVTSALVEEITGRKLEYGISGLDGEIDKIKVKSEYPADNTNRDII